MNPFQLRTLAIALTAGLVVLSPGAAAQDDVSQLRQQIDELDRKVRALQRQQELVGEAAATKLTQAPSIFAGQEGFHLKSGDRAFSLRLGAVVQADSRWYADQGLPSGAAPDNFLVRKARPILEALMAEKFLLRIMPDFGSGATAANGQSVQEAYLEARLDPAFNIRAGKFKSPVGLERLQLDAENEFIERALPTNLVPNRDVGVQIAGFVLSNKVSYQFGIFDGVYDNGLADGDNDSAKDVVARVFVEPFRNSDSVLKGLGFGVSGSTGRHQGSPTTADLPQFKTMGQQNFFTYASGAYADGTQNRLSPQLYFYVGPYGFLGEYISSRQKISRATSLKTDIDNRAWQLAGYWVITGENASYHGIPVPSKPFSLSDGRWGAFELAVRFSKQRNDGRAFAETSATQLASPSQSAREAREIGVGLNCYLNRNVKMQINYEETHFEGGTVNGDRPTEKAILTRFQIAI
ncbi:MAG: porin [Betaproteobacteria bacterium]